MKSLREIFESIAYAGMKPDQKQSAGGSLTWLGPLRKPLERLLNGPAASDPFYLTNRTTGQKARLALLIAIPFVLVLTGVYLAATGYFDDSTQLPAQTKQMSNAEIAAKMMPDLNKDLNIESNKELQVLNIVVMDGHVSGTLKNNTNHLITDAEVIVDLTDTRGSKLGAVSCKVPFIDPNSSGQFQTAVPQSTAAYAVVREVHSN